MSDLTRIYELGYLLLPTLGDEKANEKAEAIKQFITSLGGEEIAEGQPERIDLAYTMVKVIENKNIRFVEAYFGWYKFTLDADKLALVKEFIVNDLDTIRHILFKTVRENTFMVRKGVRRKAKLSENGEEVIEGAEEEVEVPLVASAESGDLVETAPVEEAATESEILDTKIDTLIPDSE